MEIFLQNIPYPVDDIRLTLELAPVLHSPLFEGYSTSPGLLINFKVYLFPDKRYRRHPHSGSGTLTVPSEKIGNALLKYYSGNGLTMDGRRISLKPSKHKPRSDTLGEIQHFPYRDPRAIREKESRLADFSNKIQLQDVQFAWQCRDDKTSIEWQWNHEQVQFDQFDQLSGNSPRYTLLFKEESREIIVRRSAGSSETTIVARYSRVQAVETDSNAKAILLLLESSPSLEKGINPLPGEQKIKRRKLTHLDSDHAVVAPFAWNILRLVCESLTGLAEFKRMASLANINVHDHRRPVVWRGLFAEKYQRQLQQWLGRTEWSVAFQCEALYRDLLLDTVELLDLGFRIETLVRNHGPQYTVQVLRQFGLHLRDLWYLEESSTVWSCFEQARDEIAQSGADIQTANLDKNLFQCLHVTFTPTAMKLRGPFPDASNRILRQHPHNQDAFLRVSFTDEDGFHFTFDRREVDGPEFIAKRVGTILKEGFDLCGRHFEFLAYSQSALKQYTVWFVTPFRNPQGREFNAKSIRATIGSSWSTALLRCPARYAARLSQAFTATEFSVVVEPDMIQRIPDIEHNEYCFSDGNGPVSQGLADEIYSALQRGSARTGRGRRTPSVFQVRIQGAKGVLSVDPTLDGLVLGLRPSMVKFESSNNYDVEIARSFDKPGKFFLNRPLIMILAGLGVDTNVFLQLQRNAVLETQEASRSLKTATKLLETHGLGAAFALPSIFSNLRKLGIDLEQVVTPSGLRDAFLDRCLQFAVHHVLREIKFRARVPVPHSWKLVGVVDVSNTLRPNEIYACLVKGDGANPEYIEGRILISKSPTIHPGDVQIAHAIGAPPVGSPLGELFNCVVFSQQGDRPLPNKLSGSDLDGDEYDLILLPSLHPPRTVTPGGYPAAPRQILDRDSTIDDVADFVVNFINNDMLGIVATNFLLIADRVGIFAEDCAKLAELHSWAVDFPKNGIPVPIDRIPQPAVRVRPDWYAPEITNTQNADYYESQSALGKLFRDIKLPPVSAASYESHAQQRRSKRNERRGLSLEDTLERLSLGSNSLSDPIAVKLRRRLTPLVDLEDTEELTEAMSALFDHFAAELEHICFAHTLSRKATVRLTEEEVFMGTIIAKSAQSRMRRDGIAGMRDETSTLVRRMLKELEGDEDPVIKDWVNRSWTAWRVSLMKKDTFGAKSFGWIALRAIFETIRRLDD
ncbi:RNA dependent RNA polymerase-domain-containing protein [Gautieria morchelliformis]|nr:RNA dependent RNA polymerase-domain-containing protein [Gautieria morchelliformis]